MTPCEVDTGANALALRGQCHLEEVNMSCTKPRCLLVVVVTRRTSLHVATVNRLHDSTQLLDVIKACPHLRCLEVWGWSNVFPHLILCNIRPRVMG